MGRIKSFLKIANILFVFVLFTFQIIASDQTQTSSESEKSDETSSGWDDAEAASEAIQEDIEAGGSNIQNAQAPEGTHIDSGSQGATIDGEVSVNDGKVDAENIETDSGAKAENIKGFYGDNEGGFYADSADYFEYNGFIAENIESISGSENEINIGRADKVTYKGTEINNGQIVYASGNLLSVAYADLIKTGDIVLPNTFSALLKFDDSDKLEELEVRSISPSNEYDLGFAKITLEDDYDFFEAEFLSDGSIIIETPDSSSITAGAETVVTLTNKVDPYRPITGENITFERQVGDNKIVIDKELGIIEVHLAPTGRYISYTNNSLVKPFAIYTPPENEFTFYLKKHATQDVSTGCTSCGIIDYQKKTIIFRGIFEYERQGENLKFFDIIESKSDDNVMTLDMDDHLNMIENLEFAGSLAHFYSGPFEVKKQNGENFFNYHEFGNVPYIIDFISPNIDINSTGILKESYEKASFTMYDAKSEKGAEYSKKWAGLMNLGVTIKNKWNDLIEKYSK